MHTCLSQAEQRGEDEEEERSFGTARLSYRGISSQYCKFTYWRKWSSTTTSQEADATTCMKAEPEFGREKFESVYQKIF